MAGRDLRFKKEQFVFPRGMPLAGIYFPEGMPLAEYWVFPKGMPSAGIWNASV
jgi:hypothetical protein